MATPLTDLVEENRFFPILANLLECLRNELAEAKGPDPCFIGLTPAGRPPLGMLTCGGEKDGVAWVSPVMVFPSTDFPTPDEGQLGTGSPLAIEIEMGVARSYPAPVGRDAQADPQAYFDTTRLYLSDMAAMRRAIQCCFKAGLGGSLPPDLSLGAWTPIEAEARAGGGTWQFWVQ